MTAAAIRANRSALGVLDDLGEQLLFYVRAAGLGAAHDAPVQQEVVRLLAEVSFGTGALAVVGGTVGVIAS